MRFFSHGTSDEMTLVLSSNGEYRKITLEVTTALATVGSSAMKLPASKTKNVRGGFTLLEVMFAVVAFCTATFAILALVSQLLETARRLQRPMVDSGLVASQLSLTNKLVEGMESGDLSDLLGDEYKGFTYDYAVDEAQTNKLFQMVIALQSNQGGKPVVSKMTVLFYRPDSLAGSLDGAKFYSPMKLRIANCELRICRRRAAAGGWRAGTPSSSFVIRQSLILPRRLHSD